jgi:hypothetical protein
MPSRPTLIGLVLLFFVSAPGNSQTVAPKDARAVSLLSSAVSTLANGTSINDVTLTGTVTRTAGSDVETGSATLEALGGTESRVSLALTDGQQTETINQSQAVAGQWSNQDGVAHAVASHNCWIPANWYFPALALAEVLNDPSVTIAYVGQETRNGEAVQRIRFFRVFPADSGAAATLALLEHLTTGDIYFDAANSLPAELDFNIHPDNNAGSDIPVEVRYSGYQKLSGIFLPTHIEKRINHAPFLDFNLTGATINTNIPAADFSISTVSQ